MGSGYCGTDWRIDDKDLITMSFNGNPINQYISEDLEGNEIKYLEGKIGPITDLEFPIEVIDDEARREFAFRYIPAKYEGIKNGYELFGAIYHFYQTINPETGKKYIEGLGENKWYRGLRKLSKGKYRILIFYTFPY